MTPKALVPLVSLLSIAIVPASIAQNPSRAKHEPGEHRHFGASLITTSAPPSAPSQPPTGPVVPLPVLSIKMLSSTSGWASSGSQLFYTSDNGADWRDISPAAASGDVFASVFFLNTRTGWLLTAHSDDMEGWSFVVWRTGDGGSTWTGADVPRWHHDRTRSEPGLADHGTITFTDPYRGWLSLDLKGNTLFGTSTMLVTFDGGRSWDWAVDGPDTHISDLAGAGDSLFTVGWSHGASDLESSSNGVTDFTPVFLPVPKQIAANSTPVYSLPIFTDARNGHEAVRYQSANGAISTAVFYSTSNGGRTWHADGTLGNLLGSEDANVTLADSSWIIPFAPDNASTTLIEFPTSTIATLPNHQSGDFGRCTLSFSSPMQGWSDCGGDLMATGNGGYTWSEISPRASNGILTSYPITPPTAVPPLVVTIPPAVPQPPSLARMVSQHLGFDSAVLPDAATMKLWWRSSPYYDIGIYAPGSPNGPNGPAPNAAWVSTVAQEGWGIIPIWAGLQSPCGCNNPSSGPHAHDSYPGCRQLATASHFSIIPKEAELQGEAQAHAAYNSVRSLGLDGSIIYVDIEGYDTSAHGERNLSCVSAAEAYVAGWTKGMHQDGGDGSAGVYGELRNAAPPSNASGPQEITFAGADSIFLARDDNRVTVWGLDHDSNSQLDDSLWPNRQRIHQFRSEAQESWGGASLYVDSNVEDAPVAGGNHVKSIVPTSVANIGFGPNSYLTGVTDGANRGVYVAGQVVGVSYNTGAWSDGTSFTLNPGKTSPTGGATPIVYGAISTVAFAINNSGQVVGYYRNVPSDIGHGFLYTPGKGFLNFDVAGANWTELYSINDAGWILGGYANSDGISHCVLYKPPYTAPVFFDDPGGSCFSTSVNGIGQIAGAYPTDPSQTAFIPFVDDAQGATPGNTANYQPLSTPSVYTFPQGINNNGIIAGEDANSLVGFFLDPRNSNSYVTMPALPNTSESTLLGLNDSVQASGWVYTNQSQGILLDTAH